MSRRLRRVGKILALTSVLSGAALACTNGGGPLRSAPKELGAPDDGGDGAEHSLASLAPSSAVCITQPAVPVADQSALEAGNVAFAFDLYGAMVGASPGNVFVSPYSVSTALAMAYAGALGATASEMAAAMHFTLPQGALHPAMGWLEQQIASRGGGGGGGGGGASDAGVPKRFELHQANSTWGYVNEPFKQPFLDTLASDYCSGLWLVDFASMPEPSRLAINAWVSDRTGAKIPSLLPPTAITSFTRLVLVDALYFDASWAQPFDALATQAGAPFTRLDGSATQVAMMRQIDGFSYASGPGYQAIELPYADYSVVMDIVLPTAGTESTFEAGLSASAFASIVSAFKSTTVDLSLPKFGVGPAANASIKAILQQLGIVSAFDTAKADFTGIAVDPRGPLFISDVFHQAYVSVDEDGTEAAAATAVVIGVDASVAESDPPPPVPMVVDHSFFVAIRDQSTGTILFAGRIADPGK